MHLQPFIVITPILYTGFVQVLKGEGMPIFGMQNSKGDLYVEYNVVLPVDISSDMRRSKSLSLTGFSNCICFNNARIHFIDHIFYRNQ